MHECFNRVERGISKRNGWKASQVLAEGGWEKFTRPRRGKLTTNVTSFKDSRESTNLANRKKKKPAKCYSPSTFEGFSTNEERCHFRPAIGTKTFCRGAKINFLGKKRLELAKWVVRFAKDLLRGVRKNSATKSTFVEEWEINGVRSDKFARESSGIKRIEARFFSLGRNYSHLLRVA